MLQVKIVPVTAFAQNCSIVWDSETKEAVLIDAGGEPEKLKPCWWFWLGWVLG